MTATNNIPDLSEAGRGKVAPLKPLDWQPGNLDAWISGKTSEDLDALECNARALYPETLRKVRKGKALEVPILMRVPNNYERIRARGEALLLARKWLGIKAVEDTLTIERAQTLIGHDYWIHIDNLCLLSHAIRDTNEEAGDYPRHMLPEYLDALYPPSALYDALQRLDWYATQEDPRIKGALDPERFVALVLAIDQRRNLSPLVAIAGREHESFIVSMAAQLATFLMPKS